MRIVVADDHPLYLEAVCTALQRHLAEVVLRMAQSVDGVLALADQADLAAETWDLVLLDYGMPGMVPVETALARLQAAFPQVKIAVMSGIATLPDVQRLLALGVRGFLPKTMAPAHFAAAVSLILAGGTYLPTEILRDEPAAVFAPMAAVEDAAGDLDTLTPREREVLGLIARGLMNKEIGRDLGLAEMTVKLHVRQILRKINARNRSEAATIAVRHGMH